VTLTEWEWLASATCQPNGLVSARCLNWPRCNLLFEPRLSLRRSPFRETELGSRRQLGQNPPGRSLDQPLQRPECGWRSPPLGAVRPQPGKLV
jgi:hypothetical protein